MQMLLITIVGTQKSIDLQVPGELALNELLPTMLEACCSPTEALAAGNMLAWQVIYGNTSLSLTYSLVESGVLDGAILRLQNSAVPVMRQPLPERKPQQFTPRSVAPGQNTGGIGVRWSKD